MHFGSCRRIKRAHLDSGDGKKERNFADEFCMVPASARIDGGFPLEGCGFLQLVTTAHEYVLNLFF